MGVFLWLHAKTSHVDPNQHPPQTSVACRWIACWCHYCKAVMLEMVVFGFMALHLLRFRSQRYALHRALYTFNLCRRPAMTKPAVIWPKKPQNFRRKTFAGFVIRLMTYRMVWG